MRNIKFRAWSGLRYVFELVINIDSDGEVLWLDGGLKGDEPHAWKEEGLEQFTGLKDKNGVDIYEGDIIKAAGDVFEGEVIFDTARGIWGCQIHRNNKRIESMALNRFIAQRTRAVSSAPAIIGNIHETPELITKEI